ncbi:MAG: hypothetical protein ABJJ25_03630 [Eudoraea sp.]|uniref:hypothetical protein n=1 Tax=Eudoraea sp. TaxID=1979955 RepID=UPI0032643AD4
MNHSLGKADTSSRVILQDASQLKLNSIPPPAREVVFIKERLPIFVLANDIV